MMTLSRRIPTAVSFAVAVVLALGVGASPALAETHPFLFSFGSFTNPNGIAVEESTGDVYVADLGTDTVSKFDANGNPVDFSALGTNALSGSATPAKSFFATAGTQAEIAVDNACVLKKLSGTACTEADPSAGDLYVIGHEVIDKFNTNGEYLGQIAFDQIPGGPPGGGSSGFALEPNGDIRVLYPSGIAALFDNTAANNLLTTRHEAYEFHGGGLVIGPNGDSYIEKEKHAGSLVGGLQPLLETGELGVVNSGVAGAVDPVSGHLYIDNLSSVTEWDTGGMNGPYDVPGTNNPETSATGVSTFGSLELSGVPGEQGGIAVDGASGEVYVSNPADGKVYVFASTAPAVAAGTAANVSETGATLHGSVDPRGVPVSSCEFQYEKASEEVGNGGRVVLTAPVTVFSHSVQCAQEPGQIGSGTSPVGVSADIGGLEPGVLYHFRVVAGNANGSSPSEGLFVTAGTGFGIKSFEVSFLNRDGTPDTQAGSHPYKMVTNVAFKTKPQRANAFEDSRYEREPEGNVKDVIVDLPPGFFGDPNATEAKCTLKELEGGYHEYFNGKCPAGSLVGELKIVTASYGEEPKLLANMVAPHGVAAQLGANFIVPKAFINVGLQTGGDYGLQAESLGVPAVEPLFEITTTLFGVTGSGEHAKPFLTMPSGCTGPLRSSLHVDSYQSPGAFNPNGSPDLSGPNWKSENSVTHNTSGEPVSLTGCSKLLFPPAITVAPDVSDASTPSGLTVGVHVPQTAAFNPEGLAESSLRDTTVTLPEGVAINPAGADGLEACSEGLAGFTGFEEFNPEFEAGVQTATFTPRPIESLQPGVSFCPNSSKIGTAKVRTPLLQNPLEGAMYLAAQTDNPFGSLIAMYLIIEDPVSGSTIKLAGEVLLCESAGQVLNGVSCKAPGQIVTTFKNTPDLPFEELELHFFGGERAPLSTPSRCGTYTTNASFTPWDGNAPVNTSSNFEITSGPNGSPCPGQSLSFDPSLTAGTTSIQAGGYTPFTMTMSRKDGSQNLRAIELHMPPGLSGTLSTVKLCGEPQADEGTCGPESLIGETIVSVGVGGDPFSVTGGKVYITGPYEGAPFGLSIVNPAKAGPFDLEDTPAKHPACDCLVVRAKVEVNPITAALTITSDDSGPYKIPTIIEGIPLQIQHVNVTINRPNFTFNPTNCSKFAITGALSSTEGATDELSVPFQATNCAVLSFQPHVSASTSGKTSRADGASLKVNLSYTAGPYDTNISKFKIELPKQLPSRLSTLQKACTVATFEANPADCPAASKIGQAHATTPLIPVPLDGPLYFVSHGGAKFPEVIVVLEGYGVTIDLHGETFINKEGVTSSTFNTVPDAPVGTFEATLPEGSDSALAANGNLCSSTLTMPTEIVAQNGAMVKQNTKISISGCKKAIRVVRHKVKGKKATIMVSVPSAGKLLASGAGVSGASANAGQAGTVAVTLSLSNPEQRFLARHPGRKLRVAVKLLFNASDGSKLSNSVMVLLR
jgi:hypothetical protein